MAGTDRAMRQRPGLLQDNLSSSIQNYRVYVPLVQGFGNRFLFQQTYFSTQHASIRTFHAHRARYGRPARIA